MQDIRRGWAAVVAMFALNGVFLGVWASRVPAVAERYGLSPGGLGLVLLAIGLGAIVSFPLAGRLADKRGAARVTLWLALGHVAAMGPVALAPNVWALVPALFAFGAMQGGMDVTMNAWAGEVEKASGRPIMSVFHGLWSLGAATGAATGFGAVSLGIGITPHFIAVSLLAAVPALLIARGAWVSQTHAADGSEPVFVFPKGALLVVGAVALAAALGEGSVADWGALFLVRVAGAGEASAALGYTVFALAMVTVRVSGGGVVGALGPVRTTRIAGLLAATGAGLAVAVASYPVALAGFVLMGAGYALVIPLAFSRAANDPFVKPGRAIASVATLGYGGVLLGPPIIGFVAEATSVRFSFGVVAALALVISVFAHALQPSVEG
ncbi:MAG TPA: MFS transporter [Rhodobacteraceae bacterium]|nr:MFS transporter [Paracoccaceae bacterium]